MSTRLFVAIALPEWVKDELDPLCTGLPGAKWNEREQLHLTLRFVGEVDGDVHREIERGLARVEADSFRIALRGLGTFPPRGPARVLWGGVEHDEGLTELQRMVDKAVVRAGAPREKRKFHAHVTLGRVRDTSPGRLRQFIERNSLFRTEPFLVDSFHLYRSELRPKGAEHTCEASYALMAAPGEDWDEDEEEAWLAAQAGRGDEESG